MSANHFMFILCIKDEDHFCDGPNGGSDIQYRISFLLPVNLHIWENLPDYSTGFLIIQKQGPSAYLYHDITIEAIQLMDVW